MNQTDSVQRRINMSWRVLVVEKKCESIFTLKFHVSYFVVKIIVFALPQFRYFFCLLPISSLVQDNLIGQIVTVVSWIRDFLARDNSASLVFLSKSTFWGQNRTFALINLHLESLFDEISCSTTDDITIRRLFWCDTDFNPDHKITDPLVARFFDRRS